MGITRCPDELFTRLCSESVNQPLFVLKLIDRPSTDPFYAELVERLMQEAELCGLMASPQFPIFSGTVRRTPLPFFVMEWIRGTSLADFLADRYFSKRLEVPWPTIYMIFGQLLYAIREAHKRGCIHRDLKYDNVMVMEMAPFGVFVRVIDFGFAKVLGEHRAGLEHLSGVEGRRARQITTAHSPSIATPAFAPPELYLPAAQRKVTPATDTYMLGGILFWMCMGDTFLPQSTDQTVLGQAMARPVPRIVRRDLGASSNANLNLLVGKMLQVEQTRRPQNVDEVIAAFEQIERRRLREENEKAARATARATGSITMPPDASARSRPAKTVSRTTATLIAIGAGVVCAALAAAVARLL